jgi:aspartate-semialdehyde dehydrogenase
MSSTHKKQYRAGILGATGMVGQRFISLLDKHPYISAHVVGASPSSAGKAYAAAARWKLSCDIPDVIRDKVICPCEPSYFKECDFVFSGLDSEVAGAIGQQH